MRQNLEEPDYRSMNKVQLKCELINLEKRFSTLSAIPSITSTIARSWTGAVTMRRSRRSRR
ncbi:MAG: hypothetical protein MR819_11120 [Prevotella sp.]|nr:hypothetical protein [Prevotella sp.]